MKKGVAILLLAPTSATLAQLRRGAPRFGQRTAAGPNFRGCLKCEPSHIIPVGRGLDCLRRSSARDRG